jgi:hypothetical protein
MRRSSRVLIAGLVLVVLGLGNWLMARSKLAQYGNRIAYARELAGPGFDEPYRGTGSILQPRTTAHELYEDWTAKREYYLVVHRGGRMLMAVGLLLTAGAVVRQIRVPVR